MAACNNNNNSNSLSGSGMDAPGSTSFRKSLMKLSMAMGKHSSKKQQQNQQNQHSNGGSERSMFKKCSGSGDEVCCGSSSWLAKSMEFPTLEQSHSYGNDGSTQKTSTRKKHAFGLSPVRLRRRSSVDNPEELYDEPGIQARRSKSESFDEDELNDHAEPESPVTPSRSPYGRTERRNSLSDVFAHKIKKAVLRTHSKEEQLPSVEHSHLMNLLRTSDEVDWMSVKEYLATTEGQRDFQCRLQMDPTRNKKKGSSVTLLHKACQLNPPVQFLKMILEHRPEWIVDGNNEAMERPLHLAAAWGASLEVITFLVKRAPEVASQLDHMNRTPLHLACECGWPHLQWRATQAGLALPDMDDESYKSCTESIDLERRRESFQQVMNVLFCAYPPAINMPNSDGFTPLEYVEWHNAGEWIVKTLTHQIMQAKEQLVVAKFNIEQKQRQHQHDHDHVPTEELCLLDVSSVNSSLAP